jgi:hypothetical protein
MQKSRPALANEPRATSNSSLTSKSALSSPKEQTHFESSVTSKPEKTVIHPCQSPSYRLSGLCHSVKFNLLMQNPGFVKPGPRNRDHLLTPLATIIPTTTGTSDPYTGQASLFMVMAAAKTAVKKGVVAPMAWLKETGRKRREMLPPTTEVQKMTDSAQILTNWLRERMGCIGTIFSQAIAM